MIDFSKTYTTRGNQPVRLIAFTAHPKNGRPVVTGFALRTSSEYWVPTTWDAATGRKVGIDGQCAAHNEESTLDLVETNPKPGYKTFRADSSGWDFVRIGVTEDEDHLSIRACYTSAGASVHLDLRTAYELRDHLEQCIEYIEAKYP